MSYTVNLAYFQPVTPNDPFVLCIVLLSQTFRTEIPWFAGQSEIDGRFGSS